MKLIQILVFLFIGFELFAQEQPKKSISQIGIQQSSQYFSTKNYLYIWSVSSELFSNWEFAYSHARTNDNKDNGISLTKTINRNKQNIIPRVQLNSGDVLPQVISSLDATQKLSDSLTLMMGAGYLHRKELTNLLNTHLGLIKVLDQQTIIARVFNTSGSEAPLNPTASFAMLKESKNSLIQVNIEGGRQTIVGVQPFENQFQNFVGGGLWYRHSIGSQIQISATTTAQHHFLPSETYVNMIYFNLSMNYQF